MDEKTKIDEVADETASTIDEADIDEAKDKVEDSEDIDTDAVRDEIRDEDDDTRGRIDEILTKLDEFIAHIDARIDGLSRVMLDGGAVITDGQDNDVTPVDEFVDLEDLDFTI